MQVAKTFKGDDHIAIYEMCLFIEQMTLEGYSLPSEQQAFLWPRRHGSGWYEATMISGNVENTEETGSDTVEAVSLDDLTKKAELLEYAEVHGFDVPKDMTHPAQIKKYIKENS